MLTVEITNDGTGTNAEGNYDYRVSVGGRVIAEGRVEKHARVARDGEHRETLKAYAKMAALMQQRGAKS